MSSLPTCTTESERTGTMPPKSDLSVKQFFFSSDASQALAQLCQLMVRKHGKAFTLDTAVIQCVADLKDEEQEAVIGAWSTLIAEYENLDEKASPEGGRLRHEPCGQIVTRAILNRE